MSKKEMFTNVYLDKEGKSNLIDVPPIPTEISEINYNNSELIINWIANTDSDFQSYEVLMSNKNVKNASQLKNIISSHRPDENIDLLVLRNGFEMELTVNLGSRPDEQDLAEVYKSGVNSYDDLGLMVDDLESNFAREKGIEEDYGVVVMKVKRQSPSNRSNIKPGDVITKIGRNKIMSTQDYHSFIKEYQEGDSILLLIKRDGTSRFVAIEI